MRRKGPQRHSTAMIQSAIAKFEGGMKLSDIAKSLQLQKSTVKYWLDNANKFQPDEPGHNPVAVRIQGRLTREVWDIIFASLKILKKKLSEASARDLVQIISELFDRQAQFGSLTAKTSVPDRVMEVSEEVKITVQKFLERKETNGPKSHGTESPMKESQAVTTVEPIPAIEILADAPAPDSAQAEGNSANG